MKKINKEEEKSKILFESFFWVVVIVSFAGGLVPADLILNSLLWATGGVLSFNSDKAL